MQDVVFYSPCWNLRTWPLKWWHTQNSSISNTIIIICQRRRQVLSVSLQDVADMISTLIKEILPALQWNTLLLLHFNNITAIITHPCTTITSSNNITTLIITLNMSKNIQVDSAEQDWLMPMTTIISYRCDKPVSLITSTQKKKLISYLPPFILYPHFILYPSYYLIIIIITSIRIIITYILSPYLFLYIFFCNLFHYVYIFFIM